MFFQQSLFSLSVFYLPDLSALCSSCGDVGTTWANPWGCCPLCHLSSPCCQLSMSDKLPGLPDGYRWHSRWLVCMTVCVLWGQRSPEAGRSRDDKVPGGHLLCDRLRCVVTRYQRWERVRKTKTGKQSSSGEAVLARMWRGLCLAWSEFMFNRSNTEKWQHLHLQPYQRIKTWNWSLAAASLRTPLEDSFTLF